LLKEHLFLYKLQDDHLISDHSFCYIVYFSQHLQLPPRRAKLTSNTYEP